MVVIKPIILITPNYNTEEKTYSLNKRYCEMISNCGAIPIIIPYISVENIEYMLSYASGVLFTGGGDISPRILGIEGGMYSNSCNEKRDIFELNLSRICFEKGIPILGICRGMQIMCVAAGGSVFEDIQLFSNKALEHMQSIKKDIPWHKIYIKRKSVLNNILGKESIYVNSLHHQCVKESGFLKIGAVSPDGVIEAVEKNENGFALGLQWHPEHCIYGGYSEKIFNFFINKCKLREEFYEFFCGRQGTDEKNSPMWRK